MVVRANKDKNCHKIWDHCFRYTMNIIKRLLKATLYAVIKSTFSNPFARLVWHPWLAALALNV